MKKKESGYASSNVGWKSKTINLVRFKHELTDVLVGNDKRLGRLVGVLKWIKQGVPREEILERLEDEGFQPYKAEEYVRIAFRWYEEKFEPPRSKGRPLEEGQKEPPPHKKD